ncbi:MAG: RNA-directed DNA polymerase [Coriobacteriia bacterium]|nr:RNA-directed DNA polymerase [Coriobacteriia bacterium]
MKSYNDLWRKFLSDENIILAYHDYALNSKDDKHTRLFNNNPKQAIINARNYALKGVIEDHTSKYIKDGSCGKIRKIIRPKRREQILHHMAMNVVSPIFMKPMYRHVNGSIPERGCVSGRKYLEKWIKNDYKGTKYYLKMDIRKYFENVNHDILKAKLTKIIKDKKFLAVLCSFVDVRCDGEIITRGIPLGFYTSQWYANFYLTALDHYIKEELHARYYMRYMDDMIVLDSNKRKLFKIAKAVGKYLREKLDLELKPNWLINRLGIEDDYSLDFMGFRFYRNRVTLRKNLLYRLSRKARAINKKGANIFTARQFMSFAGWTKHANVYNNYQKWVKPYCSKRAIRKKISRYDRRLRCGKNHNQTTDQH